MNTHTPAPWREVSWLGEPAIVHDRTREGEFDVVVLGKFNPANARLITAAPDLLAALKAVAHEIERRAICINMQANDPMAVAFRAARAAIAKAEGQP